MSQSPFAPRRPSRVLLAVLLAFGATGCAHADERDVTPGVSSSVFLPAQAKGKPPAWSGRAFRQGVVAVANPYGAEAGAAILEQGGNAIDAAVAIAYALNVVEPQSAGIGGGGFMMIHLAKTGQTFTIDTREKAPAGATRDMFVGVPNFTGLAAGRGGRRAGHGARHGDGAGAVRPSVAGPGAAAGDPARRRRLRGHAALRQQPRLRWHQPTSRAKNSPLSAEYFCPGGQAIPAGTARHEQAAGRDLPPDRAARRRLLLQVDMPDKGCDIALGIVEGQKWTRPQAPNGKGGSMTLADLEAYQPAIRAPIEGTYRGYRIKSMPPPSSGALTVIQILKMLERFPLGDASRATASARSRRST